MYVLINSQRLIHRASMYLYYYYMKFRTYTWRSGGISVSHYSRERVSYAPFEMYRRF